MTFAGGNRDGKHYWLTPPALMRALLNIFHFDHDACPHPKPVDYDGLTSDWGDSTYVNPPFGSIDHNGKKKGPTAWARKAIIENAKGKRVVMVYPVDKWILMMLDAGAIVRNLGDVEWHSIEDNKPGKGIGRYTAIFILEPKK